MKKISVCLIVWCIILSPSAFCQQKQLADTAFTGLWVNTQYEEASKTETNQNILELITPRYIQIDSLSRLTIYIRTEQKAFIGSPVGSRKFGNLQELKFKNGLVLNQIKDVTGLISFEFPQYSVSIVFKKIDKR